MANDPSGDLQIKPAGTGGMQTAGTSGQTAPPPADPTVSITPASAPVIPAPAAPVTDAAAPAPVSAATTAAVSDTAQPVNKRVFNLEEGVAEASTGQAKPEKFAIPKMVREKYPELIELIKITESMDDQERQYWFQIMPVMTTEQIEKFRGILVTEKQQLADLDKEYENELNSLNEKHLLEWKEFETKEKSKAIKEAEAKSSEEEKKMEEDLLAKLSNV